MLAQILAAGPLFPLSGSEPKCAKLDPGSLCGVLWRHTSQRWLATLASWGGLTKVFTIVMIVLIALVLRWLINRAITKLTRGKPGGAPAILKPLKERAPSAFLEAAALLSERRTQRAQTIGSVLRSITSAAIFTIAVMTILGEVGLNLAPLIASAGIAGVAIGFGAQNLVKDFLSGMFMMLEDQYGVGDVVDLGEASGTVESVGLRVTTVRDSAGVVWYIRNGEIVRVGNKSQGWAMVNVDVPVPFGTDIERTQQVMQEAADTLAGDDEWKNDLLAPPEALGVEQITGTGLTLRVNAKTTSAAQWRVARELRRRVTEALDDAKIQSGTATASTPPPVQPPVPPAAVTGGTGAAGPT
jgi:small conductance mechanosensitive channel